MLLICFLAFTISSAKADTIWMTPVSTNNCTPGYFSSYFMAQADSVYNDTATRIIHWGDGTIDTFDFVTASTSASFFYKSHNYFTTGNIQVLYEMIWPDGSIDSVIHTLFLSSTCGNVIGKVFADYNSNCVFETTDDAMPMTLHLIDSTGTIERWAHTDTSGFYTFGNLPSNNQYYVNLIYPSYLPGSANIICPASGIDTVGAPDTIDFAVSCSGIDLIPGMRALRLRPGGWSQLLSAAFNMECTSAMADMTVPINDTNLVTDSSFIWNNVGANSPLLANDTLTYSTDSLNVLSMGWSPYYYLVSTKVRVDTNANIGDSVFITSFVLPVAGESDTTNNVQTNGWEITNSYDPNYIAVTPTGRPGMGRVRQNLWMTYTIHFQNTGNDTAINVKVIDSIDISKLDLGSIQLLGATHPVNMTIVPYDLYHPNIPKVVFSFDDILLPDSATNPAASQGEVTFAIKQRPDLPHGTLFHNRAGIYFDYNAPIITNTVTNSIDTGVAMVYNLPPADTLITQPNDTTDTIGNPPDSTLAMGALVDDPSVRLYPNPVQDIMHAQFERVPTRVYILSASGQVLQQFQVEQRKAGELTIAVPVEELPEGSYRLVYFYPSGEVGSRLFVKL